jgi:DNA repair ATPase RecN
LGIDDVDFFLYHNNVEDTEFELRGTLSTKRGGKVESVASAGEIARIILAIECQVPGSIRALCGVAPPSSDSSDSGDHRRPVAVIYDEIDAHVGGRALVSVGQLLSEQSESYQVVAITHSASLAATADLHICVQKQAPTREGVATISAQRVDGTARLKELARMASGDMAMDEAEAFAEALIDAATMRQRQTRSKSGR